MELYTRREEIANSVTHGHGVGLSVAALITLLIISSRFGDATRVISFLAGGCGPPSIFHEQRGFLHDGRTSTTR